MKNARLLLAHPYFFLAVLALSCLPFIFLLTSFLSKLDELDEIGLAAEQLHIKEMRLKGRGQSEEAFLSKMKNADHFYIDKNIETLLFLEPEIARLEIQTDPAMKKRLEFLKGNGNKLLFAEEEIRKGDLFQEVEERPQHAVEMNADDLKKLLCLVEGIPIPPFSPLSDAPQLLIKKFELIKKPVSAEQEVYVVNMHLIKREGK